MKQLRVPLLVLGAVFLAGRTALGFELTPLGPPSQINVAVTMDSQDHATVAMARGRESMIVWRSEEEPGDADGLYHNVRGRVFDRRGNPLGPEFLVNAALEGDQHFPDVSTDRASRYVVVWSDTADGARHGVRGKIYSLDGRVLTGDFVVARSRSDKALHPSVAMNAAGDFIVIWNQYRGNEQVFLVRVYDAAGRPLTGPIRVNHLPVSADAEGLPDIVLDDRGNALAAWVSGTTPASCAVVASVFNVYELPDSIPQELAVAAPPPFVRQKRPMVDLNEQGDRVVAWNEEEGNDARTPSRHVAFRKFFGSSGQWSDIQRVRDDAVLDDRWGNVALFPNGALVVAWATDSELLQDPVDVYLRQYGPDLRWEPQFQTVLVNEGLLLGSQTRPALAFSRGTAFGYLTVTWESSEGLDEYRRVFRISSW